MNPHEKLRHAVCLIINPINMRKIFLAWLLLGAGIVGHAQIVTIKDRENSRPIEMATLASQQPRAFATTNAVGQADISAFKGSARIEIRVLGYKPVLKSFAELEAASFSLMMTRTNVTLDMVIVSATRWNQTTRDVPGRITSIPARDVALQNPQTAADLLASSGEVFIQKSQQGGGSPMIRGFATNRLLYTVDGVRMNTAIFRAGNLQNVISLDPFTLENAEVLFGPGSVIYGSDAIGGVMTFQTLTPKLSANGKTVVSGQATMRYSSGNSEKTGHFDVNVGWKRWALLTSASSNDYGDLRMGAHGPDDYLRTFYVSRIDGRDQVIANPNPLIQVPTGYAQHNLMQKVRFSPDQRWDLQYGFHYSETSAYSRYDRLIETTVDGVPRSAEWSYGPQKWMMNLFSATHRTQNPAFNLMALRLAHQYFEESRIDRNFSGGNRNRLRTQLEQVQAFSFNADFEKSAGRHELFYGIEAVVNDVRSRGTALHILTGDPIAVADRYPQAIWQSYAGYLNYQFRLSEKLLAQAGARYSRYGLEADFSRHLEFYPFDFSTSSLGDGALTGSLGAVYSPTESWRLSFNASTGYRAPNVDDVGKIFDFAAGEVVVPNPGLKAEYAWNGEVNVARIFGDLVKLDFTAYYTQLTDAMVRREYAVNGQDSLLYDGEMCRVFAIQNAAWANVFGFNAGMEVKLPAGFGLSTHYNYQVGREEMDDGTESRSRHAAPPFGVTRLTYTYEKVRLQVYAIYCSEVSYENLNEEERQKPSLYAKDADGNPYSPAWYTLNFKATCQLDERISVSAGLENITDRRYRPYSSGLTAPGRNFLLSARFGF
jgi:hemoglobin/transferrin/lactoferrin receptor protein